MSSPGAIIILTGGVSRRMGQAKAQLRVAPGKSETFLERILRLTEGLALERVVVSSIPLDIEERVVPQPNPEEGQLSSLMLGWRALKSRPQWVMKCLVDHPYVSRSTLEVLVAATKESKAMMWSPSFQKQSGHPVIFSSQIMRELEKAPLESGARPVVRRFQQQRAWVEVDDPAILWDTDTPEDYQRHATLWLETST